MFLNCEALDVIAIAVIPKDFDNLEDEMKILCIREGETSALHPKNKPTSLRSPLSGSTAGYLM